MRRTSSVLIAPTMGGVADPAGSKFELDAAGSSACIARRRAPPGIGIRVERAAPRTPLPLVQLHRDRGLAARVEGGSAFAFELLGDLDLDAPGAGFEAVEDEGLLGVGGLMADGLVAALV